MIINKINFDIMFKIFWLGEKYEEIDDKIIKDNSWDLEIEMYDESEELDDEVGQIALDVLEWKDKIHIIAPIAWVELSKITISLQKTVLTIEWNREKPDEYEEDDVIIRNSECYFGKFLRNIILPENLKLEEINAYMDNNMLFISIPKLKFGSKEIPINKFEN